MILGGAAPHWPTMKTARTPLQSEANVHAREACFHDGWAESTRLEDIKVYECFEAVTAMENRFMLTRMGTLREKKVLDVRGGFGESSAYLALH